MSDFSKFLEIRRTYAQILPEWMAEYDRTGDMRHDPYFMDWEFTPIERNVWSDIRTLGLPFFPQMPVLNYFLDFGNPFLKIGIECDGKAWHDHDLDRARDARLADAGWMIFRIEGHECVRMIPAYEEFEEEDRTQVINHYMTTSEGILTAIKRRYFDADPGELDSHLIDASLFEHRSTRENVQPPRRSMPDREPVRMSDTLDEYMKLLQRRMQRNAA